MRSHTLHSLQVLRMHQDSGELVSVQLESVEDAQPNIVDAALHRAVHRLGMIVIVVLRSRGMQLQIRLLIVSLLEQYICTDLSVLKLFIILHGGSRDVYIYTPDRTIFMMDIIDSVDALKYVLDGVVDRILTGLDGKSFVSHILQRDNLVPDLLLCQLHAAYVFVGSVIGTVETSVHTVVR